jgi:hypothetical protein
MEITIERRHDDALRAVINQAIEFKQTLGPAVAASFWSSITFHPRCYNAS